MAKGQTVPATAIAQVAGSVGLAAIAIFPNWAFEIFSIFQLKNIFLTSTISMRAIAISTSQKYPATYGHKSLETWTKKNTVTAQRNPAIKEYKIQRKRLSLSRWSKRVFVLEIITPHTNITMIDTIAYMLKYSWKNIQPSMSAPSTLVIVLRLADIPIGSFFTAEYENQVASAPAIAAGISWAW